MLLFEFILGMQLWAQKWLGYQNAYYFQGIKQNTAKRLLIFPNIGLPGWHVKGTGDLSGR